MGFILPYVYFIALSFFVSLLVFVKPRPKELYLNFFPPFLLSTLIVEIVGLYIGSLKENNNNSPLYNWFTVFEFCFYLGILRLIINNKNVKKVIIGTIGLYVVIAVINFLFFQNMKTFHASTYALGCLLIVIFCIYYFLELFRLPKSVKLATNPAFWICSGLLFFYICGFPLFALINYWPEISTVVTQNFTYIIRILNIFLYSLFTIAFLCLRSRNYILSSS
jgi:hypothetical protein